MSELLHHNRASLGHLTHKRYPDLDLDLEKLSPEAHRDLARLIRDIEFELAQAKRTFRPFPGGPAIRM